MKYRAFISAIILTLTVSILPCSAGAAKLTDRIAAKGTFMILIKDVGNAADFTGYAENLIKKSLKERGASIINPEIIIKVKENKLLMKAIENANASAMAQIATDYGANVLIRGTLAVDTRQKFAASWEGTATLSLTAIDTATAEEVVNAFNDPLGDSMNPAPIEDSPLIAKQLAVQKVCHNVLLKMGVIADTSALKGVTTIGFELYDIYDTRSRKAVTLSFSPDGRSLLAGGGGLVESWGIYEKRINQEYRIKGGKVTTLAVSADNQNLAVGSSKGVVHIFHMGSHQTSRQIKGHRKAITALAFSPNGTMVASTSADRIHQISSVTAGTRLSTLKGHHEAIISTFSKK